MARNFNGRIDLTVTGTYGVDIDLGNRSYSISQKYSNKFANGTSDNQADVIFTDTRTTSSTDDLDLYGGLTDAFGVTVNFSAVKAIVIFASTDNTAHIKVGGGSNNVSTIFDDVSDIIHVPPGGMFVITDPLAAGFGVTDSTADILRIASASGSQTYDVIIIGNE